MEPFKKILRTPSAFVLLLVAITSLIGVVIKSNADERIARIPVDATITAEVRLTQLASILPTLTPTNPVPTNTAIPPPVLVLSPKEGSIPFASNERGSYNPGVEEEDFLANVTFYAPYTADKIHWDVGIVFGDNYLITVRSSSQWALRPIAGLSDLTMNLNIQEEEPTHLSLLVYDGKICFKVNDILVENSLTLPNPNVNGLIYLVTNNFEGDSLENNEVAYSRYSGFEIYRVSSFTCE